MRPFIQTDTDRLRLLTVAHSWIRTPYAADGAVKGTGCSCSMLPYAILTESGMDLPKPPRRGLMLKVEILPAMLEYLHAHEGTHFQKLAGLADVVCGDIPLFNAGIGHLTLSLGDNGRLIHSWQTQGVHYTTVESSHYINRFVGAWRPIIAE